MKIKCGDGKVRRFRVSEIGKFTGFPTEARCLECGEGFGTHDTYILKPLFKKHICKSQNHEAENRVMFPKGSRA